MAFTDEEFEDWHRTKLQREFRPTPVYQCPPIATCLHCHQPFGINEGTVTGDVAICDNCNGD